MGNMKLRIRADVESPVVRVAGPGYSREFPRDQQPFEVSEPEARLLEDTGLFESESEPGA
jgi:hypothetical protein